MPYGSAAAVVSEYGKALHGKVIIDPTNPVSPDFQGFVTPDGSSGAQEIAKAAPEGAHVVKAFNTLFSHVLAAGPAEGRLLVPLGAGEGAGRQLLARGRGGGHPAPRDHRGHRQPPGPSRCERSRGRTDGAWILWVPRLPAAPLSGKTVIETCNYGPERDGHTPELDSKSLVRTEHVEDLVTTLLVHLDAFLPRDGDSLEDLGGAATSGRPVPAWNGSPRLRAGCRSAPGAPLRTGALTHRSESGGPRTRYSSVVPKPASHLTANHDQGKPPLPASLDKRSAALVEGGEYSRSTLLRATCLRAYVPTCALATRLSRVPIGSCATARCR
ncbi:hypothetical protein ACIOKD_36645 [Streptomyces sp. NPDC087844]|uniref:hypothetical protein n=1 Tax=Streptomyces sp. NPDC087844 TaxID=3365805 RepID=UPI003807F44F